MAEEFQLGSGNWWERNRYESPVGSTTTANSASTSSASFLGWPTTDLGVAARSSMDSTVSVSGHEPGGGGGGGAAAAGLLPESAGSTLQMMDLSLSSQTIDWNPALFRGSSDKGESSFRSMLQEEASSTNFQHQQDQWSRHKIYSANSSDQDSSITTSFQLDSSSTYGITSPNPNVLQGLLVSDNQQQHQPMNYSYPISSSSSYGGGMNNTTVVDHHHHHQLMAAPSWSNHSNSNNNLPQFLRNSPPKQPTAPVPHPHQGQLHFSNNTPFWNASSSAPMNDVRSSLFPSLQSPIPLPNFEDKSKNTAEAREAAMAKKGSNETSNKRPRNETPAPMPAFKVRKEKMGDRITALQQLVSPFGKTDTASVLSEAIEYIKFLHEQVSVLSTPYLKSGVPMAHLQNAEKSKDQGDGPKPDLRSRGLCLVPVSSTFPVTQETTVDFWTPTTFGAPFR